MAPITAIQERGTLAQSEVGASQASLKEWQEIDKALENDSFIPSIRSLFWLKKQVIASLDSFSLSQKNTSQKIVDFIAFRVNPNIGSRPDAGAAWQAFLELERKFPSIDLQGIVEDSLAENQGPKAKDSYQLAPGRLSRDSFLLSSDTRDLNLGSRLLNALQTCFDSNADMIHWESIESLMDLRLQVLSLVSPELRKELKLISRSDLPVTEEAFLYLSVLQYQSIDANTGQSYQSQFIDEKALLFHNQRAWLSFNRVLAPNRLHHSLVRVTYVSDTVLRVLRVQQK